MKTKRNIVLDLLLLSTLFFSSCSTVQPLPNTKRQCLLQKPTQTSATLEKYLYKTDKTLAGHSAFYPLALPQDALAARLFLIDHAQKSIDVQYYIYENDTIGALFSYHLYLAALRGVKVRILLDDISTTGKDKELISLSQHQNIELKLFNPNRFRTIFRNLALLLDINTLGKRMHNKALIVDNYAAIIGGRNIGDVYYASHPKTLFLDYDVLIIGKVVPEISDSFNIYWNSKEAYFAEDILDTDENEPLAQAKQSLCLKIQKFQTSQRATLLKDAPFTDALKQDKLIFTVARQTNLFYDLPNKVTSDENNNTHHISKQISEELKEVDKELLIISPYFIPSEALMQRFRELRKKGVAITVITNSLASTDVFPVYGGYVSYIKPLTQMGVQIYELKATLLQDMPKKKKFKKPPALSLHTKLLFFDNKRIAIGSANIDPRSEKLNTELLVIVTSTSLTTQEKKYVKSLISLKNFYEVSWGKLPKGPFDDGIQHYGPIYTTLENNHIKHYYTPPKASFFKRLGANISRLLPIEGYL